MGTGAGDRTATLAAIREFGVVAVLRGPSAEATVAAVDALVAGGIRGVEVTYSTPDAAAVVRALAARHGDRVLLGMGTLTDPAQAAEARAAGARFLVTPVVDEDLARAMTATGLVAMLGALTPTEVLRARRLGADVVKLFPGSLVGPAYVRALRGPFPDVPLMPTGGVSAANVGEWLAAGAVAVGAGGELCPAAWMAEGRLRDIEQRAREFVAAVARARAAASRDPR